MSRAWRPRTPTRADRAGSVLAGLLAGAAVGVAVGYVTRLLRAREPLSLAPPGDAHAPSANPDSRRPEKGAGDG